MKDRRKEMFYLTTHSTHFIYGLYGVSRDNDKPGCLLTSLLQLISSLEVRRFHSSVFVSLITVGVFGRLSSIFLRQYYEMGSLYK